MEKNNSTIAILGLGKTGISVAKYLKNKNKELKVLDIGTGSGCLAICIAKEFTKSKVTAIPSNFDPATVEKYFISST